MTEPTTRPDDEHGGIDNATEEVVANWQDATEGVADDGSLAEAAERGTEADRNNPA